MPMVKPELPERSFVSSYRMRCRSVAGIEVTNLDDLPFPSRADGWQDLEFQGATELMNLIEFWGCPVTIAPPERGCEFWSLELENGKHDGQGSMLDVPSDLDAEFPS